MCGPLLPPSEFVHGELGSLRFGVLKKSVSHKGAIQNLEPQEQRRQATSRACTSYTLSYGKVGEQCRCRGRVSKPGSHPGMVDSRHLRQSLTRVRTLWQTWTGRGSLRQSIEGLE